MKRVCVYLILLLVVFGCEQFQVMGPKEFYEKGDQLFDANMLELAIAEYQKGLKLNPKDPVGHYKLGVTYKYLDKKDDAIREFQETVKLDPTSAGSHHLLGELYYTEGKTNESIAEFNEAIKQGANYQRIAEVFSVLGQVYYYEKNFEQAAKCFVDSVAKEPNNAISHLFLGRCYRNLNKLDDSLVQFQEASRLDPKEIDSLVGAGSVYELQNKFDEALAKYNEALKLKPDIKSVIFQMGGIYYSQGKYEDAAKKYEEVLKIDPSDVSSHFNVGLIYDHKLKSKKDAVIHYRELLRLNPNFEQVELVKARIKQLEE